MAFLELTFDLPPLGADEPPGRADAAPFTAATAAEAPTSAEAAAEAACFAAGALSVTLSDAADDPVLEPAPGEVRLWPATRLTALFAAETAPAPVVRALTAALGLDADRIAVRHVTDRVWEREWLAHFHPMRFGRRLWVAPHHESVAQADAVVVRLDPGLAFGTGTHPTTAMCLEWLDAHLAPGSRVVDYGCGSGILALAAARLGAARVECFDIDPQALTATEQNAAANGVHDRIRVMQHDSDLEDGADVLLANILSEPLRALAPRFARLVRAGGRIVLSGLLGWQTPEVTEAYRAWFDMDRFDARDDWVGLTGVRRRSRDP